MRTTEQTVRAAPLVESVGRAPASGKMIGGVLTIAVPVGLWFSPLPLAINSRHALAVASFMIIAWITEALPQSLIKGTFRKRFRRRFH